MLARNSDLCRLATSSSALRCLSSRYSWALSRASVDWSANISSRVRVSAENSPGRLRRTTSEPTIWPSRSSGTATSERQPASYRTCRCGSSSACAQVGRSPAAGRAWRRGRPASRRDGSGSRAAGRSRSGRCGRRCGPGSSCSVSSYSMIEPPSVAEIRTACLAMVASTLATSRLELTASPTSRNASSSPTLRAEFGAAGLQLLHELHTVDRHRRLSGEGGDELLLALVERARPRSARHSTPRRPRRRSASAHPSWSGTPRSAAVPAHRSPVRRARRRSAA